MYHRQLGDVGNLHYYHMDYLEIIRDYTTPLTLIDTDNERSSVSCSFMTMRKKRRMLFSFFEKVCGWLVVTFINRMSLPSHGISMCGKV